MTSNEAPVLNDDKYTLGKIELIKNEKIKQSLKTKVEIKNKEVLLEKIQKLEALVGEINAIVSEFKIDIILK